MSIHQLTARKKVRPFLFKSFLTIINYCLAFFCLWYLIWGADSCPFQSPRGPVLVILSWYRWVFIIQYDILPFLFMNKLLVFANKFLISKNSDSFVTTNTLVTQLIIMKTLNRYDNWFAENCIYNCTVGRN